MAGSGVRAARRGGETRALSFARDPAGRVTRQTLPDGRQPLA